MSQRCSLSSFWLYCLEGASFPEHAILGAPEGYLLPPLLEGYVEVPKHSIATKNRNRDLIHVPRDPNLHGPERVKRVIPIHQPQFRDDHYVTSESSPRTKGYRCLVRTVLVLHRCEFEEFGILLLQERSLGSRVYQGDSYILCVLRLQLNCNHGKFHPSRLSA